jgi:hypothetical protein
VLTFLTEEQMEHHIKVCLELRYQVFNDPSFIKLITMGNKSWVHKYDPKTIQSQWKTANSPCQSRQVQSYINIHCMP